MEVWMQATKAEVDDSYSSAKNHALLLCVTLELNPVLKAQSQQRISDVRLRHKGNVVLENIRDVWIRLSTKSTWIGSQNDLLSSRMWTPVSWVTFVCVWPSTNPPCRPPFSAHLLLARMLSSGQIVRKLHQHLYIAGTLCNNPKVKNDLLYVLPKAVTKCQF